MKEFTAMQEEFFTLQSVVSRELKDECKTAKISWLSLELLLNIYSFIISLVTFFVLIFLLAPLVWQLINNLALVIPKNNFNTIPISILIVSILWLSIYSVLCRCLKNIFRQVMKNTISDKLFKILEFLIIVPSTTIAIDGILHFAIRDFTLLNNTPQYLSGLSTLFYLTPISLTAFVIIAIFTVVIFMPASLTLIIETSLLNDSIINRVIERKYIHTKNWSDSLAQKILAYNKRKLVNIPAQVQIATPALAAPSLLSLLALYFKPEDFQDIVKSANSLLGRLSVGVVDSKVLIIAVIVLPVVGIIVYISRAFWQLRVLEIVDTLCLIRIEEREREKKDLEEQIGSLQAL